MRSAVSERVPHDDRQLSELPINSARVLLATMLRASPCSAAVRHGKIGEGLGEIVQKEKNDWVTSEIRLGKRFRRLSVTPAVRTEISPPLERSRTFRHIEVAVIKWENATVDSFDRNQKRDSIGPNTALCAQDPREARERQISPRTPRRLDSQIDRRVCP
jgi:hypothetical protein